MPGQSITGLLLLAAACLQCQTSVYSLGQQCSSAADKEGCTELPFKSGQRSLQSANLWPGPLVNIYEYGLRDVSDESLTLVNSLLTAELVLLVFGKGELTQSCSCPSCEQV